MSDATATRIRVEPSGAALGADIVGADLADPTQEDIAAIRQAWIEHRVLRFRGCAIDDRAHVALARKFGDLEYNPGTRLTGRIYVEGIPEIVRISNIVEDGKPIGELGAGEAYWHTDMCFIETPPMGALLRAIEVPDAGGDTSFMDMHGAWDLLPGALRRDIAGLSIKHDAVYAAAGRQRPGTTAPAGGDVRDIAGAVHPIVTTHPETGRPSLYLGKRLNAYVVGLPVADSEALLDRLWAHVLSLPERHVWTQRWRPGDMLMWDNRCTMHRRDAFDAGARRLLHRTVIKGTRPS
jgi:taurine dioxygenase